MTAQHGHERRYRRGTANIPGNLMICLVALLLSPCAAAAAEFSGYAETKGIIYTGPWHGQNNTGDGWGTLYGIWRQKAGSAQLTAALRGELLSQEGDNALAFDPADRKIRRTPLSLREFWLRTPLGPADDLQVGRFQLGWGKTDGYSPADAFLPRDLTDPFADEKLPLWGVRLNGYSGALRYEAVVVPVTTPWRLPQPGGRNAPMKGDSLPSGATFSEPETTPPVSGFAAMRLQGTFGEWELGGWARGGVRPAPLMNVTLDQATVTPGGIAIPAERRYAREEAAGIDVSRIVGSLIVRCEGAALFSRDSELGNALIGAASVEKGFGDATLLVTVAGNAVTPPVDPAQLYDRALLPALIAAWNSSEEWGAWKLVWTAGLKHGDGMFRAEAGYNVTDLWKVTLGGEMPYGSANGALGAMYPARRLHMALRRSW